MTDRGAVRVRRPARPACLLAAALLLQACGGPDLPDDHVQRTREEAVLHDGDVSVRASVVPTAALNDAMARQYGIDRSPRSVLLLVGVRQGPEREETALQARVTAHATDLRGVRRPVRMREIASGDLVDYIGTVRVSPPDTLRFDLQIVRGDGGHSNMQFSRDVFPQ